MGRDRAGAWPGKEGGAGVTRSGLGLRLRTEGLGYRQWRLEPGRTAGQSWEGDEAVSMRGKG